MGAVPYVVAIIELDDCKEEDGTVTRVAGGARSLYDPAAAVWD